MHDTDHRIARKTTHRDNRAHYVVTCSCGAQVADTDSERVAQQSAREHLSNARQRDLFDKAAHPHTVDTCDACRERSLGL